MQKERYNIWTVVNFIRKIKNKIFEAYVDFKTYVKKIMTVWNFINYEIRSYKFFYK